MNESEYEGAGNITKNIREEREMLTCLQKPIVRQILVSSSVCASFFELGLFLGACPVLVAQLRREPLSDGSIIDDEKASWISSAGAFSGIPCVLLLGLMGEYLGRKPSCLFMCLITCASFVVFFCATSFTMLILAMILQGPLLGGSSVVCMMLTAECVSPKYRGLFTSINSATIFWAIWVANAVGTFFHWKNICIIGFVVAVYNTLIATVCPESPYWLASKGKFMKCRETYRWYIGTEESAEKELECLIKSAMERSRKTKQNNALYQRLVIFVNSILAPEFYKPLGLCIILSTMFHLSGKYVLCIYAIDILKKITGSEFVAYTGMLMLDGVTVLGMYIGSFVFRYTERRTFYFSTAFLAIFFLFVLYLYLQLIKLGLIEENVYFSISLLLLFSFSITCGPMLLNTVLLSELFPLKLRTLAGVLQCIASNIIGGVSLKLAPWVFNSYGTHGTFLFFAIALLVCTLILMKYLPETKNKTLDQIESMFKENKELKDATELVPLTVPACSDSNVSPRV